MLRFKKLGSIAVIALVGVTAMEAIAVDHMKVVTVCKDVRVGMDGGIGAILESGGVSPRYSITLLRQHYKGHDKIKTLEVTSLFESTDEVYSSKDVKLKVSSIKKAGSENFPAIIEAEIDGKKIAASLVCKK